MPGAMLATGPGGTAPVVIGGVEVVRHFDQLKRLGLQRHAPRRPMPNFTSTLDGFYSNFKDDQIKRGIEAPAGLVRRQL